MLELDELRRSWFNIALMICIALPIMILLFIDYYNMEGYNYLYNSFTNSFESWNNTFLNQNFSFEVTWKGRMFYLIFLWLLVIESVISWHEIAGIKPCGYRILASLMLALIPTLYVLATNFLGLDLILLRIGHDTFGIRSVTPENQPWDFLYLQWPISCEYIVFTAFFVGAVVLAYRRKGLKYFSISLTLLGGIGTAYMFDTIYPFGVFRPLQAFALPTSAIAAAILDLLGYAVRLTFPVYAFDSYLPSLAISMGEKSTPPVIIAWACAGVQSLLLYVVIILVFFKKAELSAFRKLAYFIIGLFATFFVNVLRVISILIIMLDQGNEAGMVFHNTYGEMYSVIWILLFMLLIGCIERFMLVEKTRSFFRKISSYLENVRKNLT